MERAGTATQEAAANRDVHLGLLARLLSDEIKSLEDQRKRPGWTAWAMAAALASLVWLLLQTLENGTPQWERVAFLVLALSVLFDSVFLLSHAPGFSERDTSRGMRLLSASAWGSASRLFMLVVLLRQLSLLYLLTVVHTLPVWLVKTAGAFLGMTAFLSLSALVVSLTSIMVPLSGRCRWSHLAGYVLLGIGLLATYLFARTIFTSRVMPSIPEWQAGFILTAIPVLLAMLARSHRESPLVPQMKDMYRHVCLGQLDYQSAVRETDLLIFGLTIETAMQPQLARVLEQYRAVREELRQANAMAEALENLIQRDGRGPSEEEATVRALFDSLEKRVDHARPALDTAYASFRRLQTSLMTLKLIDPHCEAEMEGLVARYQTAQHEVTIELRELRARVNRIKVINQQDENGATSAETNVLPS